MHERNRDRALTDRRGDPLDIAATHIADRENPRAAGFEEIRRPGERPTGSGQNVGAEIRAGLDEAFLVERDAAIQPARVRNRAGHDEEVSNRARLGFAGRRRAPGDALEPTIAVE